MKSLACQTYLKIIEKEWQKVHKRNNNGVPDKYDIEISNVEQLQIIEWIEIIGYFYNKKILKVINKLIIYFEPLREIQYQNLNQQMIRAIQQNIAIVVTDELNKLLQIGAAQILIDSSKYRLYH